MDYKAINEAVFPASAGVILKEAENPVAIYSFPRIRGGDPRVNNILSVTEKFSPHPRG